MPSMRAWVSQRSRDQLDRVVEAFGGPDKYAMLARIQARYDQANLFRMNYNIPVRR